MTTVQLPKLTVSIPGQNGEDFVVPDPDVYTCVMAEVLESRVSTFQGQVKEGKYDVRIKMQIVGGEFDGVWFKQWLGYSTHEKSRMRGIIDAIRNNRPLEPGSEFDLGDYLNKPFRAVVEVDEVASRDGSGRTLLFAKVTKAMPVKTGRSRAAAPAPAPVPVDEDDSSDDEDNPFEEN